VRYSAVQAVRPKALPRASRSSTPGAWVRARLSYHRRTARTGARNSSAKSLAAAYFAEKGVAMDFALRSELDDMCLADVESAKSSAAFMANVIAARKRRNAGSGPEGD